MSCGAGVENCVNLLQALLIEKWNIVKIYQAGDL
jgi:hypothetical protein